MHPGDLVFISQPEHGVGNAETMFCTLTEEEEEEAIIIDPVYSVTAENAPSRPL